MPAEWQHQWFGQPTIDLRSSEAFQSKHINNTTSLPWQKLPDSMHELPDKHQVLQLIGAESDLNSAKSFLEDKGYEVNRLIESSDAFWTWASNLGIISSGCNSVPLWQANPHLISSINLIEQNTSGRTALDFACGAGRDSVYLAMHGWQVTALDNKKDALSRCKSLAKSQNCIVSTLHADMEMGDNHLLGQNFDLIVVMRYLYRPFLPELINHLNPGGLLCYSTFMVGSEKFGSPRNPKFLLRPNELAETFEGMKILINEESKLADGRPVSYFLAQKQ